MSICHEIPEESPFMSYRDMKRYWKNTVSKGPCRGSTFKPVFIT